MGKRIIKLSMLSTVFVFIGCHATMERLPGTQSNSQYAPANAKEQHGLVSYENRGLPSIKEKKRKDAYRQMFEACNGKYKIISESNKNTGAVFNSNGYGGGYMTTIDKVYIKFMCIDN
jgi:hypothetical protein